MHYTVIKINTVSGRRKVLERFVPEELLEQYRSLTFPYSKVVFEPVKERILKRNFK
ncbi:MAG: hypothetical protein IPP05_22290 [Cytophagaceae bacterium]|nr:hypothetical protein [Cytophagaceae bacterium]